MPSIPGGACNLLIPGVLARSHPSKIVARWKRYVRPENFRFYFFDDLKENPAELRQSILRFLGGDPDKPSGSLKPHDNNDAGRDKLRLTAKVRDRMAQFFEHELKRVRRAWFTREKLADAIRLQRTILLGLLDDNIDLLFGVIGLLTLTTFCFLDAGREIIRHEVGWPSRSRRQRRT